MSDIHIDSPSSLFNLAHFIPKSNVNGPGDRAVVWVGGCLRGCYNCFNPELWSFKKRNLIEPSELAKQIIETGSEGLTLSGGDPLDSPYATLRLLEALHDSEGNLNPLLSKGIILFTGFTIEEIEQNAIFTQIVSMVDLLIEGRYIDNLRTQSGLHGSSNQRFIWNSKKGRGKMLVNPEDIEFDQDFEVHIQGDKIIVTGFPEMSKSARKHLKDLGLSIKNH